MISRTLLLATALLLSGCSVLPPVPNGTVTHYVINTLPSAVPHNKQSNQLIVLVNTPRTSAVYNTQQIAYTDRPYQLAYFAKNRWIDTPANMLQPLIVQTLQKTQHFYAVISSPPLGHYDLVLNTELLTLQQSFLRHPSQVQLLLNIRLVDAATGQIKLARRISIDQNAPEDTPYGGVVAANRAVAKALAAIALSAGVIL